MTDLSPLPDTPTGRYRHYKGLDYQVMGVARHSETLDRKSTRLNPVTLESRMPSSA